MRNFLCPSVWNAEPTLECGFYIAHNADTESRGFANEFGEFHRLDALNIDVALLSQPTHTGQSDLVFCAVELRRNQYHAGQSKTGIALCRQHQRITRFGHQTQINEPNLAALRNSFHF